VPQVWSEVVEQIKPPAQFAMAVQVPQTPVPLPAKPLAQTGQIKLLPSAALHVSVEAQFAMVPQSMHVLLLSHVPVPQAEQVPVPSPT
jgi:hypothetical protein